MDARRRPARPEPPARAARAARPGRGMTAGYLGLGSNVGDRRANLQAAVDALPGQGVTVLASSSTYDTDPVGLVLDQPAFLNACVRIATELEPEALLDACKAVERDLGRDLEGGVRHGPRPIDVDLLLLGGHRVPLRPAEPPARAGHGPALRPGPAARARLRPAHPGRDAAVGLPGADAARRGRPARRRPARRSALNGGRPGEPGGGVDAARDRPGLRREERARVRLGRAVPEERRDVADREQQPGRRRDLEVRGVRARAPPITPSASQRSTRSRWRGRARRSARTAPSVAPLSRTSRADDRRRGGADRRAGQRDPRAVRVRDERRRAAAQRAPEQPPRDRLVDLVAPLLGPLDERAPLGVGGPQPRLGRDLVQARA